MMLKIFVFAFLAAIALGGAESLQPMCYTPEGNAGFCQSITMQCNGRYDSRDLCAGDASVQCCVEGPSCFTPEKFAGVCMNSTVHKCSNGAYDSRDLCSGPYEIQCCVEKVPVTCFTPEDVGGICQTNTQACSGIYDTRSLCPGPGNFQCCVNVPKPSNTRQALMDTIQRSLACQNYFAYTEGPDRWNPIDGRFGVNGKPACPNIGDCSSYATWVYWTVIGQNGGPDILNGANWSSGYTGTLLKHGRSVQCPGQIGDLVIYGQPGSTGAHVAIYVGGGYTIGHGEPGLDRTPWQIGPAPVESCRSYVD